MPDFNQVKAAARGPAAVPTPEIDRNYKLGSCQQPPVEIFVNFFPVAVHVFSTEVSANADAARSAGAGFATPNTAHYRRVDEQGKLL